MFNTPPNFRQYFCTVLHTAFFLFPDHRRYRKVVYFAKILSINIYFLHFSDFVRTYCILYYYDRLCETFACNEDKQPWSVSLPLPLLLCIIVSLFVFYLQNMEAEQAIDDRMTDDDAEVIWCYLFCRVVSSEQRQRALLVAPLLFEQRSSSGATFATFLTILLALLATATFVTGR